MRVDKFLLTRDSHMIDIHLHIFPCVDDGLETREETSALTRVLVQEYIRCAVATPHYNDDFPHYSSIEVQKRVDDVQRELDRNGVPLLPNQGNEFLIQPQLIKDIQVGRLATLYGSHYLLLELWNSNWLPDAERVVFELRI